MDLHLEGKRAIVSGGSKGIGLAIARGLAQEGVDVAISSRGPAAAEVAAQLAAETGRKVVGIRADTADDDAVRAMVAQAVAELGGVDILVNTAATAWTADMNKTGLETTDELVRSHFEVKVLGICAPPGLPPRTWSRRAGGASSTSAGSVRAMPAP